MRRSARQLREQPRRDREAAEDLSAHQSELYVPAWLTAPLAAEATYNGLRLYQNLLRFREVDEAVVEAALNNMRHHTSYLEPETVMLCLASEAVNADYWADVAPTLLSAHTSLGPRN